MASNTMRNEPLLSVVVPVYNVSAYLDQCLESVFTQDFTESELEVLVVDDGSTDGSALLIEKWARKHRNLVAITRENGGLSAARNTGLDAATGKYLVFLDSDDIVPDGAYRRILDQVMSSGSDFITFAAYRFAGNRRVRWPFNRNIDLYLEKRTGLILSENPEYIRDFTAWNKLYKRDFFVSSGVRFPEGRIYEDVATSPILYDSAQRFDVYPDAGYYWRVTPGSITQNIQPRKADDRLWALEHIHEYFDRGEHSEALLRELGFATVDYNLRWIFLEYHKFDKDTRKFILERSNRLLQGVSDAVIAAVQAPLNEWAALAKSGDFKKLNDALLSGREVMDLDLVQRNPLHRAWLTIKRFSMQTRNRIGSHAKHVARERSRQARHLSMYLILRPLLSLFPLNPKLAVFSSYWGRQFSSADGPPAICIALSSHRPDFKSVVFANKLNYDEVKSQVAKEMPKGSRVRVVLNESLPYYVALWRAKYLFNDVNFQLAYRVDKGTGLRRGQVEVQTTHGVPLKRLGVDSAEVMEEKDLRVFLARSKRYTHLVSTSPLVATTWADSHRVSPLILKTGLPQNDALFVPKSDSELAVLKSKYGLDPTKRVALFAPTFRGKKGMAMRYLVDFNRLAEKMGDDVQFVVKPHPFNHTHLSMIDFREISNLAEVPTTSPFVILLGEVRETESYKPVATSWDEIGSTDTKFYPGDINELMQIADVVISDYSSLMFSYTHLDKPLILFTPDKEHYNSSRGTYFDIDDIAPGAVAKNNVDLERELMLASDMDAWRSKYGSKIAKFKEDFLLWETGDAARRILSEIGIPEQD